MKKTCIEVNNFENEVRIIKCPFCDQIILDDEITDNGNNLKINNCAHTVFWAIDDSVHFQTPYFEEILIEYPEDEEEYDELFDNSESNNLLLEDGYLDTKKNDNVLLYEISDCSPGSFHFDTIMYFGFVEKQQ